MGYLGRNVNLALLIIIIGVVVALVGTTVFFQRSLQNRTQAYETTSDTLGTCESVLANYQQQYTQALQEVNQTSQDIRRYDQLYEQKVGELKDTQGQLTQTNAQLAFEKLQKEKFQQFYETQLNLNAQLNATIDNQEERIDGLERKIRDLEEDLDACGG